MSGRAVPAERSVWGCALFRITIASHVLLESQTERVLAGLDPMGVHRRQRRIPDKRLGVKKALREGISAGCTEAGCPEGLAAWKWVCGGAAVKMDEGKGF